MTRSQVHGPAAAEAVNAKHPSQDFLDYVQEQKNEEKDLIDPFLTSDEKMLHIREIIDQIKDANVPVLISGESGTGKEIIARSIHRHSSRNNEPFVGVNCAALPSNLLESELFGYEKGAFTGAHQRHVGKFEQANNGSLLLDEITEMDPNLQAKLLRVLQEKEVERIGGTGPIPVNTRIIATTNRNISRQVAEKKFRQDLYYRLYVIHIEVPPLRARNGDVQLLSQTFLDNFCRQFNKQPMTFSPQAIEKLRSHHWPGNVRELQNIIQRTVLLATGSVIDANDIPLNVTQQQSEEWIQTLPIGRRLKDVETQFILQTLKNHQGNRTHAAKTLGISLRTLRNKINEYQAEGLEVTAPSTGRAL